MFREIEKMFHNNFEKLYLFTIIIIIFFFSFNNCFSKYELSNEVDFTLIGSSFIITQAINHLYNDIKPYDSIEIAKLQESNIFPVDKYLMSDYHPEISEISDYMLAFNMTMPFLLLFDKDVNNEPLKYGLMYLETVTVTATVTGLVKNIATRTRPFVYGKNADMKMKMTKDARLSYFSGHSSWSFASAVFISTIFSKLNPNSDYKLFIWGSTLALAATTATLRVVAGKHYFTDVLSGAVLGSFIGWFIPYLHETGLNDINNVNNIENIKSINIFELKFGVY